jgi:cystathionine beta-lyase/cystathionine gamma-synthase
VRAATVDNASHERREAHIDTAAVHAGSFPQPENRPSSPALYQASSYEFADLDDVEAIYGGSRQGSIYGRYGGPNALHFESAIAELEFSEDSVGAASGMAAIDAALALVLRSGDRVICTTELYGGTYSLLENDYQERGVIVDFVDQTDLAAVEAAFERGKAKALYVESLTNPLMHVADIPRLAAIAHRHGAILIVDATFASPALAQPVRWGADLVLHSVGKYLGGHGDVGAGVLSGRRDLIERARAYLVRTGATLPHFEAWLALRGVRTLGLRMTRHSENARVVAAALTTMPGIVRVHHPSLPSHPQHALASELYPQGTGGIVAFDIVGGRPDVAQFVKGLETIAIVHSLGEIASTISYSVLSSHRPVPKATRDKLGVTDATLRLSCGIEHADDIIADLARACAGVSARVPA